MPSDVLAMIMHCLLASERLTLLERINHFCHHFSSHKGHGWRFVDPSVTHRHVDWIVRIGAQRLQRTQHLHISSVMLTVMMHDGDAKRSKVSSSSSSAITSDVAAAAERASLLVTMIPLMVSLQIDIYNDIKLSVAAPYVLDKLRLIMNGTPAACTHITMRLHPSSSIEHWNEDEDDDDHATDDSTGFGSGGGSSSGGNGLSDAFWERALNHYRRQQSYTRHLQLLGDYPAVHHLSAHDIIIDSPSSSPPPNVPMLTHLVMDSPWSPRWLHHCHTVESLQCMLARDHTSKTTSSGTDVGSGGSSDHSLPPSLRQLTLVGALTSNNNICIYYQ